LEALGANPSPALNIRVFRFLLGVCCGYCIIVIMPEREGMGTKVFGGR